jgi:hypothetical protein
VKGIKKEFKEYEEYKEEERGGAVAPRDEGGRTSASSVESLGEGGN